MADAEPYKQQLQERGVLVVPLSFISGPSAGDGDSAGSDAAAAALAVAPTAEDVRWRATPLRLGAWRQWFEQQVGVKSVWAHAALLLYHSEHPASQRMVDRPAPRRPPNLSTHPPTQAKLAYKKLDRPWPAPRRPPTHPLSHPLSTHPPTLPPTLPGQAGQQEAGPRAVHFPAPRRARARQRRRLPTLVRSALACG